MNRLMPSREGKYCSHGTRCFITKVGGYKAGLPVIFSFFHICPLAPLISTKN